MPPTLTPTERIKTAFERNIKAVRLRPGIGRGTAVTTVRLLGGMACEVEDGRWRLTVDMSPRSGGEDRGPNPGVLGRAALGSCLSISYVMWAAKLGVPIQNLTVEVEADYDVRGEYGLDDSLPAGYLALRYVVTVESDAPEPDILDLLDHADAHAAFYDVFRRPQSLQRSVRILTPNATA